LEKNQIPIKIGSRPLEPFTSDEVIKLVLIAEEWHEFCKKQKRTEEEKQKGSNPCSLCKLHTTFDIDLCNLFQEFFRMRTKKLQEMIKEANSDISSLQNERIELEKLHQAVVTGEGL